MWVAGPCLGCDCDDRAGGARDCTGPGHKTDDIVSEVEKKTTPRFLKTNNKLVSNHLLK